MGLAQWIFMYVYICVTAIQFKIQNISITLESAFIPLLVKISPQIFIGKKKYRNTVEKSNIRGHIPIKS